MNTAVLPLTSIVLIFIISIGIAILSNQILLKNKHFKIVKPRIGQIRWATNPKPILGGYSFFATFLLLYIYTIFSQSLPSYLLFSLTVAFIFGYLDDNFLTSPLTKIIGQLVVSICFIENDIIILVSDYQLFNTVFTIFWIVGMMNSINMLDNMDGIVTSVSIIILGIALMIIAQSGNINLTDVILIVSIIGALIGFLFYNWNPAKIYMGDTGSQFLGTFLAWVSIQYFWSFRDNFEGGFQVRQFLVPTLAFIVPLMDTTTVTIRRLARRVSPFVGGRDHITHHLAYLGISDKNVVRIMIGISLSACFIIYHIVDNLKTNQWNVFKTLAVVIYYLTVFIIIQYFYEVAKRKINSVGKEKIKNIEQLDEITTT